MGGRSSFTIGNSKFVDVYNPDHHSWYEMKSGSVMLTAHAVPGNKLSYGRSSAGVEDHHPISKQSRVVEVVIDWLQIDVPNPTCQWSVQWCTTHDYFCTASKIQNRLYSTIPCSPNPPSLPASVHLNRPSFERSTMSYVHRHPPSVLQSPSTARNEAGPENIIPRPLNASSLDLVLSFRLLPASLLFYIVGWKPAASCQSRGLSRRFCNLLPRLPPCHRPRAGWERDGRGEKLLLLFTVVLKVGMSCQGCVGAVKRVLTKMEGVDSFDVDIQEQKVTVMGNVTPEAVFQTVSKTGKKTSFWEAEPETKEAIPETKEVTPAAPDAAVKAANTA
ncbi:hypothetical protein Cni_G10327 [Canna indica]|uniref:HMA domain-containing protein n=1 Tax=Canna indica TaxID=4628 RepID=A0AAQ3K5X9_9LILI|nr:hypothetical protein Cni_G10327 [Canna indica]